MIFQKHIISEVYIVFFLQHLIKFAFLQQYFDKICIFSCDAFTKLMFFPLFFDEIHGIFCKKLQFFNNFFSKFAFFFLCSFVEFFMRTFADIHIYIFFNPSIPRPKYCFFPQSDNPLWQNVHNGHRRLFRAIAD